MQVGLFNRRPELLAEQKQAVLEFNESACLDMELSCYESYEELTKDMSRIPLDILFYDTEQGEDVREQLMRVVQMLPNCRLVLVSEDERHAVFGYALHAVGYLTTPLDPEEFVSLLAYLLREKIREREQYLPLKVNGVWSRIHMGHIAYLESSGHNLIFHMSDGRALKTTASFRDYESLIDLNVNYLRCHKSYVVNLSYVKQWEMDHFTLKDGNTVNISRPYWQTVRSVYACYVTQTEPGRDKEPAKPQKEHGLEAPRR